MSKVKYKETQTSKNSWFIALAIVLIALIFAFFYITYFEEMTKEGIFSVMDITKLSNVHRNIGIVLFGIFGGGLAVWARFNNEKQIENSNIDSRNDRFAKALEMMGEDKSAVSHKGGLYMLHNIANSNLGNKYVYIHCAEMFADWLKVSGRPDEHRQIAIDTFKNERIKKLRNNLDYYKGKYNLALWPNLRLVDLQELNLRKINLADGDLQGANLQNADLQKADLRGANLQGAILENADLQGSLLEGAFISGAKIKSARNLTREQILATSWKDNDGQGEPPELPDDLVNAEGVQAWMQSPPFIYQHGQAILSD